MLAGSLGLLRVLRVSYYVQHIKTQKAAACSILDPPPHNHPTGLFPLYHITMGEAVQHENMHIGKVAALVGYLPTDFFTDLVTCVEAVRRRIPKVAHVLDAIALLVIGDIPALSVDEGHASSVTESNL